MAQRLPRASVVLILITPQDLLHYVRVHASSVKCLQGDLQVMAIQVVVARQIITLNVTFHSYDVDNENDKSGGKRDGPLTRHVKQRAGDDKEADRNLGDVEFPVAKD